MESRKRTSDSVSYITLSSDSAQVLVLIERKTENHPFEIPHKKKEMRTNFLSISFNLKCFVLVSPLPSVSDPTRRRPLLSWGQTGGFCC